MTVYQSPHVGQEISCVMEGISTEFFEDDLEIMQLIESAFRENNFTVLEKTYHHFSPQGFTALILLAESHLAVHTYPEHDSIYISMYSCRGEKDAEPIIEFLKKHLQPKKILFYHEDKIPVKD